MIYFETKEAVVEWHENDRIGSITWRGFAIGDTFRTPLSKGIELIKAKNCHKWLADLREHRVTSLEDQTWGATEWFPRSHKAGIKYWAFVVPTSVIAQMSLRNMASKITDIEPTYFDSPTAARLWLQQQPD